MKKNTFAKTLACAFAALAFIPALFAGDILEIRPLEGKCDPITALKAGQQLKFLVRMVAKDTADAKAWNFQYVGAGSKQLAELDRPKMGIVISSRMRYADYVSCNTNTTSYGAQVTDIVFAYTVQPGDFALPVRLALADSTEDYPIVPTINVEGTGGLGYYLKNVKGVDLTSELWQLKDDDGNVASFTYCDDSRKGTFGGYGPDGALITDIDLSKASFYLKSIDFDSNTETDSTDGKTYWRVVTAGDTTTLEFQPTVQTIGTADTNSTPTTSTRLYIWSDNEDAVTFKGTAGSIQATVDVPNPDGTKGTSQTVYIYPFDLVTGEKTYSFTIKGNDTGTGKTANLILSGQAGYVYDTTGKISTNFVVTTLPVKCGDKPPASIKLSWVDTGSGGAHAAVQAFTNNFEEMAEKGYPISVTLSGDRTAFGGDVSLNLKAVRMLDGVASDVEFVFTNKLIGTRICNPGESPESSTEPVKETNIVFNANETAKRVWVYPVGGLTKNKKSTDYIEFKVTFAPGTDPAIASTVKNDGACTIQITDPKPTVAMPTASDVYNDSDTVAVQVVDSYRDLSKPRTYRVEFYGNGQKLFTTNNVAFDSASPTDIKLDTEAIRGRLQLETERTVSAQVKVYDSLEQYGTSEAFTLTIPAKEKAKTVSAEIVRTQSRTAAAEDDLTFAEGTRRFMRFRLGPDDTAKTTSDLYAFVVPLNAASSNLVTFTDQTARDKGVLLQANDDTRVSAKLAEVTFSDGCTDTANLQFDIVLRSGENPTDPIVTTYQSQKLYLSVTNVMSSVSGVNINGSPDAVQNGGVYPNSLAASKSHSFVAAVNDPSTVDITNGVIGIWCFSDGRSSSTYKYEVVTSKTESVTCTHTFTSPGVNQTVQLIPVDKDMLKAYGDGKPLTSASAKTLWATLLKYVTPFKFTVSVANALHISISPENLSFTEGDKTGKLLITLSEAPEEEIKIKVTAESLNETGDAGVLQFNNGKKEIELTVKAGATEPNKTTDYNGGLKFKYDAADGTAGSTDDGWYVKASGPDDLATKYEDGEAYVYVLNKTPVIYPVQGTYVPTNTTVALNETFSLEWRASDVSADLAKGLNYSWSMDDATIGGNDDKGQPYSGKVTDTNMRTNSFKMTSEGLHKIMLTVTDKEGENYDGKIERFWYYYIAPTKRLEVRAFGPAETTKTKYSSAAGVGQGRVWANGIQGTAENFLQSWSYNVKSAQAEVYAYGYTADSEADDGSLTSSDGMTQRDLGIDENGMTLTEAKKKAGGAFKPDAGFDNYFYRWAYLDATENSASPTVTYGNIEATKVANAPTKETITLTPYDEQTESYASTRVEAIFARELFAEDNMGDINADGIPDLYVILYKFGVLSDDATAAGDDLAKKNAFNDDEDYLPNTDSAVYAQFIPGLEDTWVTEGAAFTAKLEIRGYGEGLNNAPALAGIKNHRAKADAKTTFTEVERLAWMDAGSPMDKNGDPDLTKWSPERPTDPMEADTDGDGFSDGYEYYFWYLAHVGYIDTDGSHKYLEGWKYDPLNPGVGIRITPDEIENLFDPITAADDESAAASRDTDNDGLSDLAELALGTNPILWDTDGDGLPDGYEVMYGESDTLDQTAPDPLVASTTTGLLDGNRNYDGDYMAWTTNVPYQVIAIEDANGEIGYFATPNEGFKDQFATTNLTSGGEMAKAWMFTTSDGKTYMTETNPKNYVYERDGKTYLKRTFDTTNTWEYVQGTVGTNSVVYRGLPAYVARGTVIDPKSLLTEATNYVTVVFTNTWDATKMPPERAYRVWQYGRRDSATVDTRIYGWWALSGEAMIPANAIVRMLPENNRYPVALYHHLVYSNLGFDPRTGWASTGDLGVDWQISQGNATNKLGSTSTRSYADYDEFLSMAFFANNNIAAAVLDTTEKGTLMTKADITQTKAIPFQTIWGKYCSNAYMADTDMDGIPDGWELYIMGGPVVDDAKLASHHPLPGALSPYSPLTSLETVVDMDIDTDGLDERAEFSGVNSVKIYADASSTITLVSEFWTNKAMPTDPWNADTDDDGIMDGDEEKHFAYGDPTTGGAGGGLNPLTWDTDADGLPDPWEAQYAGSYTAGSNTTSTTTSVGTDGTTNAVTTVSRAAGTWSGGMDGTSDDALEDYDQDGLLNWQEYMVNCLRIFRYDDTVSRWDNETYTGEDEAYDAYAKDGQDGWDQWWSDRIMDEQNDNLRYNPHFLSGRYDSTASWFSRCTNKWDTAYGGWYMFADGVYHDLKKPSAKYKVGDVQYNRFTWKFRKNGPKAYEVGPIKWHTSDTEMYIYPREYPGTDPTKADTDNDGMDDYYELFHGMNPLLGEEGEYDDGHKPPLDRIFEVYGGGEVESGSTSLVPYPSAKNNYWLNDTKPHAPTCYVKNYIKQTPEAKLDGNVMDFEVYPWLAGLAVADPDGDNLRNQQEAIMPNLQASSTYTHTDPTPLWMTDSSYAKSYVHRWWKTLYRGKEFKFSGPGYFMYDEDGDGKREKKIEFDSMDGYSYDPMTMVITVQPLNANRWLASGYMFAFEENEGYDSDHDYLSDFEEAQGKTKPASDPQDSDDPRRCQAMWFPGENALLQTPLEAQEIPPVENDGVQVEQPFLYYTVECWAKPANPNKAGLQTLVERAIWTGEAMGGDMKYLRKNFLIGIKDGCWFTKFDSTGTDAGEDVTIGGGVPATTNWTHVAATYDGTTLRLFVNGECKQSYATALQPEHGMAATAVDAEGALREGSSRYKFISLLVGGSAMSLQGIVLDYHWRYGTQEQMPTFGRGDYGNFYAGYVDEVRVWDGARSESQISADYKKRYSADDALANREEFYKGWKKYGTRSPSTRTQLIPELCYHFTFDHIPGAVDAADVVKVPAGFSTERTYTDARATWARPEGWYNPRWNSVAERSTIYDDAAWVPWINNTVTHLPRFDLTTQDSFYWSEDYAGAVAATDYGYTSFTFPRTHEVNSLWQPMEYMDGAEWWSTPTRYLLVSESEDGLAGDLGRAWSFTRRNSVAEGGDLLPLGGCYAKRISSAEGGMWDGLGAADAWSQTGEDSDNDGLPDWWEAYARANYCEDLDIGDPIDRNTLIVYDGEEMTLLQRYLLDLAAGMLPDCEYYTEFADTRDADNDRMPDWWENMYGINTASAADAYADADGDGLSNYAEYLIREVCQFAKVKPTDPKSDGICYDYYRKAGELYFGEIFADHDLIADAWEDDYSGYASRDNWDALTDGDGDGWTNYEEYRAGTDPSCVTSLGIRGYTLAEYPVPVVKATLVYNGKQLLTGPFVFKAWNETTTSGYDMTSIPDAIWTLGTKNADGDSGTGEDSVDTGSVTPTTYTRYLGRKPTGTRTYQLGGGKVEPGSIKISFLDTGFVKCTLDADYNITDVSAGEPDDAVWYYNTFDRDGQIVVRGGILDDSETVIGTVNYDTGIVTIDFDAEALSGKKFGDPGSVRGSDTKDSDTETTTDEDGSQVYDYIDMDKSYVLLDWDAAMIAGLSAGTHYFSEADAVSDTAKSLGHLRGGKNTFICFADADGDGEYTVGELFGVVRGVDVGWSDVAFTIELSETHPLFARVNLKDGSSDRVYYSGIDGDTITNIVPGSLSGGQWQRVRVSRYAINGKRCCVGELSSVYNAIVMDKQFDMTIRSYLSEADLMQEGVFDVDWEYLYEDIIQNADVERVCGDVTSVSYSIAIDNDETLHPAFTNRLMNIAVTRRFDVTSARAMPTGLVATVVCGACPTFRWTMNGFNTYTAFKIDLMSQGTSVYTTPFIRTPICDAEGYYAWKAPFSVGDMLPSGHILNAKGRYTWRVSMYNAKFKTDAWSKPAEILFSVNALDAMNDMGYSSIDACVKYAGPTNVLAKYQDATTQGKIRVQAYEKPDFTGAPAASALVVENVDVTTNAAANARIIGLPSEGTYYLRAYIDLNGNGEKDDFEPWGLLMKGVVLSKALATPPLAEVYIEDTDLDGDSIPDAFEYAHAGWKGTWAEVRDILTATPTATGKIRFSTDAYVKSPSILTATVSAPVVFESGALATVMLGTSAPAAGGLEGIQAAVADEVEVVTNTFRITSLTIDSTTGKVLLSIEAAVEPTLAGEMLSKVYSVPTGTTKTLNVAVYRKSSLAIEWPEEPVKTATVVVGAGSALVEVPDLELTAEELKSGFYKVDVVEE